MADEPKTGSSAANALDADEVLRILAGLGSDLAFVIRMDPDASWHQEWISQSGFSTSRSPLQKISVDAWVESVPAADRELSIAHFQRAMATGADQAVYRVNAGEDDQRWVESSLRAVRLSGEESSSADASPRGTFRIFGSLRDVTDRRRTEEALQRSETEFRALVEQASDAIFVLDPKGRIEKANPAAREFFGLDPATFLSTAIAELFESDPEQEETFDEEALSRNADFRSIRKARTGREEGTWVDVSVRRLLDGRIQVVTRDISERVEAARRIRDLAYFDSLTGLANRARFGEMLRAELDRCSRTERRFALLFLDIDRFKQVNDSLGHKAGDELLKMIGDRLKGLIRATDAVSILSVAETEDVQRHAPISRVGGDEFTILVSSLEHPQDAARVARRTIHALSRSFNLAGQEVFVGASVGIAVWPDDGVSGEELLQSADTAMYHAKSRGGQGYEFFNQTMSVSSSKRLQIESNLRRARVQDEFRLVYQPIRDARTGEVEAVETLLRWTDSDGQFVGPDEFIPIAEETGVIVEIGAWVLRTACQQAAEWRRRGFAPIRLSVNLSVVQLRDVGLVESIEQILFETGLPHDALELEITETSILDANPNITASVVKLTEKGIGFALDDFGTGYSSLSALQRFPIDRLKIDRSFVSGVGVSPNDEALASAIVALAKRLDLRVVAEGVEEENQARFLSALGCDELQGYLISRPLPAEEFEVFLRKAEKPEG